MTTNTTTHTRRAMLGAIGIGTAAIAIRATAAAPTAQAGVSPQLAALLAAEAQAVADSEAYERDVHDPLYSHLRDHDPRPAAFEASFAKCNRLCEATATAADAVADFPAASLPDLHAKTQRLLAIGYFDVTGVPEKIAADIARVAGEA